MKILKKSLTFLSTHGVLNSIASLVLALVFSSIFILISGYSPLEAYASMFNGAFVGINNVAATLGTATPLMFTGLAMAITDRAGVFNIGGEGQVIIGALTAALLGNIITGIHWSLHILICLVASALAGGFWAEIAAVLKVKRGLNEIITTIMLNYMALYLVEFLVKYPFRAEGMTARTAYIMDSAVIPSIIRNTRFNYGIFLALFIAVLFWFVLNKTTFGFELKSVGLNPKAAKTAGINVGKYISISMFISGAVAALGGAVVVLGIHKYYITGMTANYGYDGIAVAIMGNNSPIGSVISALVFGALKAGSSNMNRMTDIPAQFISVLQALIIIFVATPAIAQKMFTFKFSKRHQTKVEDD